jgi:tetratricopeptide (TPR) repeat protein
MATELHPEDLLERDARGELDEVERERLQAHLGRCAACRIERVARVDFRQEEDELEAQGATPDVQRLLARVLAAPPAVVPPVAVGRRSRGRRLLPLLVAAALVSAAAWATIAGRPGPRGTVEARTPAVGPSLAAASSPVPLGDPVTPVASVEPPPVVAATLEPRHAGHPPPVERAVFVTHAPPVDAPSAGRDFDLANAARRSGQHGAAAEQYRALIAQYPGSAEARASLVALGTMLLDDGDAAGALRSFDRYLASGGGLAEDVMVGRAVALRKLGRSTEEQRAWMDLLRLYPASVHTDRARRRLAELGAP